MSEAIILWQDPEDPAKQVTFRNGIIICANGVHYSISAERLFQEQASHYETRVEIPFGHPFPDERYKAFAYPEIVERLEKLFECPLAPHSVRYGMDGFYHLVFDRVFRAWDRQRLKAELAIDILNEYEFDIRSHIVVSTARIEVVCYMERPKPQKET